MQSFLIPSDETPEQAAARKKRAVVSALMSPPQSVGEGLTAMGDALAYRMQKRNAALPTAPGGERPSFMTAMKNMFGGRKGGLY